MSTGTVYALVDPHNDAVRYVGQTVQPPHKRYAGHLSGYGAARRWVDELRALGLQPVFAVVHADVDLADLDRLESQTIRTCLLTGERLLNTTSSTLYCARCAEALTRLPGGLWVHDWSKQSPCEPGESCTALRIALTELS